MKAQQPGIPANTAAADRGHPWEAQLSRYDTESSRTHTLPSASNLPSQLADRRERKGKGTLTAGASSSRTVSPYFHSTGTSSVGEIFPQRKVIRPNGLREPSTSNAVQCPHMDNGDTHDKEQSAWAAFDKVRVAVILIVTRNMVLNWNSGLIVPGR